MSHLYYIRNNRIRFNHGLNILPFKNSLEDAKEQVLYGLRHCDMLKIYSGKGRRI